MTKFCPECGFKQHNDNNRYCSNCGFDFSKVVGTDSNSSNSEDISSKAKSTGVGSSSNSNAGSNTNSSQSRVNSSRSTASKVQSNDFLSNLSFNKCFLAFAVLLIILFIIGMFAQTNSEPYSDNGLTSFMEKSDDYSLNSYYEDSSSSNDYFAHYSDDYSDDDSYDYLSYGN